VYLTQHPIRHPPGAEVTPSANDHCIRTVDIVVFEMLKAVMQRSRSKARLLMPHSLSGGSQVFRVNSGPHFSIHCIPLPRPRLIGCFFLFLLVLPISGHARAARPAPCLVAPTALVVDVVTIR
jgi:hypothetical protein